jgi:hypothetical protein
MTPFWLRFAYAIELLIAIDAVFTLWSQVGGQGHLDLMPWWIKLLLGGGMSLACVFATAAVVHREHVANTRFLTWIGVIVLIGAAMAVITYYYHLHETYEDDTDEEQSTSAALSLVEERRA